MQQTILSASDIQRKIKRIAIEIEEHNHAETEIVLLGIHDRGYFIADLLQKELQQQKKWTVTLGGIKINKQQPLSEPIALENAASLANKVVIIVDDVANSGRTLFRALQPLVNVAIKKLQIAVLVERQHKSFAITPDYIGLSISTTLQDMIHVKIGAGITEPFAYLE